jgi:predicted nucleic acid-binding protein
MAAYFFDSSALVKRYMSESGSAWVIGITNPVVDNDIHIVRITGVEVVSAMTRIRRSGRLPTVDAVVAISDFHHDFSADYRITEVTPALVRHAMTLAETHGLRGYDAVQLAATLAVNERRLALGLSAVTLVSADTDLNTAATAEGLTVTDPNSHL